MLTWPHPPIESFMAGTMEEYYSRRDGQSGKDTYRGLRIQKFPEDLRAYEHLLFESRADCVVEAGVLDGGAALWFLDRLRAFCGERDFLVVGIDRGDDPTKRMAEIDAKQAERFRFVPGDVRDAEALKRARELAAGRRCFVIEDSLHEHDTTRAALDGLAELVPVGGFFVVEDGKLDLFPKLQFGTGGGVLRAVGEFVEAHPEWRIRRDLEMYGVTSAPGGILERHR